MNRRIVFALEAEKEIEALKRNPAQAGLYKQVLKTIGLLETNLRHPSLQTHPYSSLKGAKGEAIFEAYAQNKTPGAYRVFWHYGPDELHEKTRVPVITIVAIVPHP